MGYREVLKLRTLLKEEFLIFYSTNDSAKYF
jgi:hypothetical protein